MNVFIGWSGEASNAVAQALCNWLPHFIQMVKPWMSDLDIRSGSKWERELDGALSTADYGIICLTPTNLESRWVLYEAGVLSSRLKDGFCPYIFRLTQKDVLDPLGIYSMETATEQGTRSLVQTLNLRIGPNARPAADVVKTFEKFWPDFEAELNRIPEKEATFRRPTTEQLLEEILQHVRGLSRDSEPQLRPPRTSPPFADFSPGLHFEVTGSPDKVQAFMLELANRSHVATIIGGRNDTARVLLKLGFGGGDMRGELLALCKKIGLELNFLKTVGHPVIPHP